MSLAHGLDWTLALRCFCCGSASGFFFVRLDPLDGLAALSSGGSENTIRTRQYSTCASSYNLGRSLEPSTHTHPLQSCHSFTLTPPCFLVHRTALNSHTFVYCLRCFFFSIFYYYHFYLSLCLLLPTIFTLLCFCFFSSNVQCSILNLGCHTYHPCPPFTFCAHPSTYPPSQLKRIFYTI